MGTNIAAKDMNTAITMLIVFSLILGADIGCLHDNLTKYGSVILNENLFSMDNFMFAVIAIACCAQSIKEKNTLPRVAYICGGISFAFTQSVICHIGYKSLYFLEMALLATAIVCLSKHVMQIFHLKQKE